MHSIKNHRIQTIVLGFIGLVLMVLFSACAGATGNGGPGTTYKITGQISAEEIIVRGRVMGSIRGKRVLLKSSCHVAGDIFHHSLTIEDGADFEGKANRVTKLKSQDSPAAIG